MTTRKKIAALLADAFQEGEYFDVSCKLLGLKSKFDTYPLALGRDRQKTITLSGPRESSCRTRLCSDDSSGRENAMSDSVYKVIEVVGTSSKSWEAAAAAAIERASQSLRDLRVAEVAEQDVQIKDGKIELYRTKLKLSFKFEGST
jgi:flavin-binding protein dodecin